jgi:hypothetical protein
VLIDMSLLLLSCWLMCRYFSHIMLIDMPLLPPIMLVDMSLLPPIMLVDMSLLPSVMLIDMSLLLLSC